MLTKRELRTAGNIIREIARNSGTSEAQIRADIQEAIRYGKSNPDPAVQVRWASFHYSGLEPTAEEFILWVVSMTKNRMDEKRPGRIAGYSGYYN